MPRTKKDTKSGKAAISKWRATMLAKYGEEGLREHFRNIGRRGGKVCVPKGFAKSRTTAKLAGYKGGRISKRGASK